MMLIGAGVFFLIYLRLEPLRSPRRMLAAMRGEGARRGGVSSFRAVTLALAGTLGVGNVVGVASALRIGGAGAIFWMWMSACIAMILKYAEVTLAVRHRRPHRRGWRGGAYYYIKDHFEGKGMPRMGATLGAIFAILILLNALTMGGIVQVNAVAEAMEGTLHLPAWVSACLLIILLIPFLTRGTGSIAALTERLVPIMSVGYLLLSVAVLILRHEAVGDALRSIFSEAFTAEGMTGGAIGALFSEAARAGTMRGLLSNEAGCGTAPTAHAAAETELPAAQGVWGIFEVFVDTILLCTATALVMLVSPVAEGEGVMAAIGAYTAVLGDWAGAFLTVAIFSFAYATLLCWMNYAGESIAFLSERTRWKYAYATALIACVLVGAYSTPHAVLALTDGIVTALTALNLLTLVAMRREVLRETKNWLGNKG
jgi:AGCS family alanine or glycine:cation symporter